MNIDRRTFLWLVGTSAAAVAGRSVLGVLAPGEALAAGEAAAGTGRRIRWAMVLDPRGCLKEEGCTKCIAACDRTHNVPHLDDRAHEIKWIWKEPFEETFPEQETAYTQETFKGKPVLVFCNHCDNPPCVRVCPTGATWKREDGVVMMDWHRCIGCRYCMAACPYGSRSFNWLDPRTKLKPEEMTAEFPTRTRGVVEKCTLCEERLARGQGPACVEACPAKAMVFGDLEDPKSEVRELLRTRYTIRRKPELGTQPEIYYIV